MSEQDSRALRAIYGRWEQGRPQRPACRCPTTTMTFTVDPEIPDGGTDQGIGRRARHMSAFLEPWDTLDERRGVLRRSRTSGGRPAGGHGEAACRSSASTSSCGPSGMGRRSGSTRPVMQRGRTVRPAEVSADVERARKSPGRSTSAVASAPASARRPPTRKISSRPATKPSAASARLEDRAEAGDARRRCRAGGRCC